MSTGQKGRTEKHRQKHDAELSNKRPGKRSKKKLKSLKRLAKRAKKNGQKRRVAVAA